MPAATGELEMKRAFVRSCVAIPFACIALALPAAVSAQTTVHVEVEVHVDAATPPAQVIVVQAPPAPVVVVEAQPEAVPPAAPPPVVGPEPEHSFTPVLLARGALFLSDEYGMAALGGAAGIGGVLDHEWSGSVVVGYLGDPGAGRSEVHLGVEIAKDFDPTSFLGFYVLFGMGASFVSDDPEDPYDARGGERMMGQLGVGARVNVFDRRVAWTLDARGVLRYALPDVHDFDDGSVSGGAMFTMGLAIRLD